MSLDQMRKRLEISCKQKCNNRRAGALVQVNSEQESPVKMLILLSKMYITFNLQTQTAAGLLVDQEEMEPGSGSDNE